MSDVQELFEELAREGEPRGAAEVFAGATRRAVRADPLDGRGYRRLASLERDAGKAEALLEIAVARAPRDLPGHAALAEHAMARRDFAAAIAHFDRMLRVEPEQLVQLAPHFGSMAMTPEAPCSRVGSGMSSAW